MSSSTLAGTSSAMRMSGASGRTGCIIRSRPDGEPQAERPRPFLGVDAVGLSRRPLEEEVDLAAPPRDGRPGAERERGLLHLRIAGEKRQRSAPHAGAQGELCADDPRAYRVEAEPEVPDVFRSRA